MNTFIKETTGLKQINDQKIKTYSCGQAVLDAITAGTLTEGDEFQTNVAFGIHEDIVDDVAYLLSVTPGNASPTNQLVTQDDISALDIGALGNRVTAIEGYIPVNTTNANPLVNNLGLTQAYNELMNCISGNTGSINSLAEDVGALNTSITCKVECSDFTAHTTAQDTCNTCYNSQLSCLNTDVAALKLTDTEHTNCISAINTDLSSLHTLVNNCTSAYDTCINCYDSHFTSVDSSITSINSCTSSLQTSFNALDSTAVKCVNGVAPVNGNVTITLPTSYSMTLNGTDLTITEL